MSSSSDASLVILCLTFASTLIIIFSFGCCLYPYYEIPLFIKFRTNLINNLQRNTQKDSVIDLENQSLNPRSIHPDNVSNIALKSFPLDIPVISDTIPKQKSATMATAATTTTTAGSTSGQVYDESNEDSVDFKSVLDDFERIGSGLPQITQHRLRRMSTVHIKRDNNNVVGTVVGRPSQSQQSQISVQYDSLSRTLLLQKLIQNQMNDDDCAIRQVKDPFSDSFISVGGIVVVVKPFHGSNDYEFASLQTGDLLRIIKFYFHEDKDDEGSIKSIQIANKTKSVEALSEEEEDIGTPTLDGYNQEICIDSSDINHGNIYCTGILLNTYLDYNIHTNDLSLCVKKETELAETDSLKDFPLNIVSLETTVLKNMYQEEEDQL